MAKWVLPPGVLAGITFGNWVSLLQENRFRIHLVYWPRALLTTIASLTNSLAARSEQRRHGSAVEKVDVKPPLFVLGHWRSGTTHLHNLLSQDPRFAFPNSYQTGFPYSFLSTEDSQSRLLARLLPKTRLYDNMEIGVSLPQEEEPAICVLTLKSLQLGYCFPKRWDYYRRYLSLRTVAPDEVAAWREGLVHFLKKLTWKYSKPLILKSPAHTCRIKLLLETFPEARFVHVHRNPYRVFQSMVHTLRFSRFVHFQREDFREINEWVLDVYREMYDCFFEERSLIPPGRFHEVSFEELEKDPVGQIERIYETLSLPGFSDMRPALERYLESQKQYEKNTFPALDEALRSRVFENWERCFVEWGYGR